MRAAAIAFLQLLHQLPVRRRADDIWPPATILLLFVYCMYVYDTGE